MDNCTSITGTWSSDEAAIIEEFLPGQPVRVAIIGDQAWQIRLEGEGWLKSIHPENAGFNKQGITRMAWALDKEGYIGLPPGPGLGVEVDEAKLEEEAKKPQTYKWPGRTLPDGSIADY